MTTKFERAIEHYCEGLESVSPGVCSICSECRSLYDAEDEEKFAEDIYNGDVNDEGDFSWHSCESCGSSLGGDRHIAHAWTNEARSKGFPESELVHLDICTDCLMFHANGDLPECWEG